MIKKLKTSLLSLSLFVLILIPLNDLKGQCEARLIYSVLTDTVQDSISVLFQDNSIIGNDSIIQWSISYGDGAMDQFPSVPMQGVTHQYDTTGTFIATLFITTDSAGIFCNDTVDIEVYICSPPIWPGDANNDGIANNIDVFSIGFNFGQTTKARISPGTTNWAPYCIDTLASAQSFADCNGNGFVDSMDVIPIVDNYELTHLKAQLLDPCLDPNAPPLFFVFPSSFLEAGNMVEVEIHLGVDTNPAIDAYGIAFSVLYNNKLIDSVAGMRVEFTNSEMLDSIEPGVFLDKDFYSQGRIDVGISKTNGASKLVRGKIASLLFVLEEDLIQKSSDLNDSIVEINFPLGFSDVTYINNLNIEDTLCASGDSATVTFILQGIPGTNSFLNIFPNPAVNYLNIATIGLDSYKSLRLLDYLGREVVFISDPSPLETIDIRYISSGSYILEIEANQRKIQKRVIILDL